VAIFSARCRTLLQYRAAALAGIVTQLFWGLIRMMIFTAFYESASGPMPMDLDAVVTYVWLGQAFLLLIPFRVDGEIAEMIRSGSVGYQMLRPWGLYQHWLARALADRVMPTLLRCGPILVVATAAGWIKWGHAQAMAAAGAALCGALLLSAAVTMLLNATMFWTISAEGINSIVTALMFVASGMIVPIPLMPPALRAFAYALPFHGMIDVPFRLFSGSIPLGQVWGYLGLQLGWTLGLVLVGRLLLGLAVSRLTVQGG
jgi:ABC-2 type transport system permease protein